MGFNCEGLEITCQKCPFYSGEHRDCSSAFDLLSMKNGTEETLPELMKYYITPEFPNIK